MIKVLKIFNKKVVQPVVRVIQKILVTVLLVVVYSFGFGITYLCALIFKRDLLFDMRKGDSFWRQVKGYEPDMEDCLRQS
jgi:hypothetical protein